MSIAVIIYTAKYYSEKREEKKEHRRSFILELSDRPYYQTEQFLLDSRLLKESSMRDKNGKTVFVFSFPKKMAQTWPLEIAYLVGSYLNQVGNKLENDHLTELLEDSFSKAQCVYNKEDLQKFIEMTGDRHHHVSAALQLCKEEFGEAIKKMQEEEIFERAYQKAL